MTDMPTAFAGPYTYGEPCACPACLCVWGLVDRSVESVRCDCGWVWEVRLAPPGWSPVEHFYLQGPPADLVLK